MILVQQEPLLRFERAGLGYGKTPVLAGVDFAIAPRSFVGILGHNGSGKTTLLKTILGLIPCLQGRCLRRSARVLRARRLASLSTGG